MSLKISIAAADAAFAEAAVARLSAERPELKVRMPDFSRVELEDSGHEDAALRFYCALMNERLAADAEAYRFRVMAGLLA